MRVAKRKYVPDNPNPVTATSFRESKTAGKNVSEGMQCNCKSAEVLSPIVSVVK